MDEVTTIEQDQKAGVIRCTKESPWDKERDPKARVRHMDASEVGADDWNGIAHYECPNCGHYWSVELPQ